MTATAKHNWVRVTRAEPCAVCGRPDWCARSDDGLILCMRGGDLPVGYKFIRENAEGGQLYGPTDSSSNRPAPPRLRPKPQATPAIDWTSRHAEGVALLHPGELHDFADVELGLSGWGVELLDPCVVNNRYAFPERDAEGNIIGLVRRTIEGRNICRKGSSRGLTYQYPLPEDDPVLVVEGASDTAAAIEAGFTAVGRPSAMGGADLLAQLLRGREVVVVGENDQKPDGQWPGRDGAMRIADRLRPACRSVRVLFPPSNTKDIRSWLTEGGAR